MHHPSGKQINYQSGTMKEYRMVRQNENSCGNLSYSKSEVWSNQWNNEGLHGGLDRFFQWVSHILKIPPLPMNIFMHLR